MQCFPGEKITLLARATDPITLAVITDAAGVANLWNPGVSNFAGTSPDYAPSMAFDPVSRYYVAVVDTTGFAAGAWTVQTDITGGAKGYAAKSAYFTFTVL